MPDELIRNVPPDIRTFIQSQVDETKQTKQAVLMDMLQRAKDVHDRSKLPLFEMLPKPEVVPSIAQGFKFIDLFAGIGGFRIALERVNGSCVFSCEWDKYSQKTYHAWFGHTPVGDIRAVKFADIPDHDVLAAGFPCQPFSIAGVSKKKSLGKAHGFADANQGNLFFVLADIIEAKQPPIIFLENVKNLRSHDGGRTWKVIQEKLDDLGYKVYAKVIDARGWVPQHRERVYIVGFRRKTFGDNPPFVFPDPPENPPKLKDILEKKPDPKYTLTDHLWNYLQEYAKRHKEQGNGFGYGLADLDGVTRTLSARYFKDGSEILVPQLGKNPRRLSPRECLRLMGFDEGLKVVVSDTQAYKQFGNAVVPKVVEAVGRKILDTMSWQLTRANKNGCLLKRGTHGVSRVRTSN